MKSHRQYVKEQVERDPEFAKDFAEAKAEVRFSVELAALREKRGLSQRALAILTGIKQPQIARLETGGHFPSIGTLLRVLGALQAKAELGPSGFTLIENLRTPSSRITGQKISPAESRARHLTGSRT
jgi:HTH-type transcriptional regulator/antitoxin HipB